VVQKYIVSHKLRRDDYVINSQQGESGRMTSSRMWQIITSGS
jgi:hypothetical protein